MKWEMVKLGDVASFINGYPFKPTDWSTEGLEIIRIQNLTKSSSEANYFSGKIPEKYQVNTGDILISWSATLDVFVWGGDKAWLNQHIFKVVFDKKEIDRQFFIFLIKHVLDDMRREVHGATMKHITKERFDNLLVPLPPLATQKRIAAILDAADALRRKDQALLQKYDELTQAIFVDMFGDFTDGNYENALLSEVSDITNGVTKNEKLQHDSMIESAYLRVANVQDGFLNLSEIKTIRVSESDFKKYQLRRWDILLTEGGDPDKLGRGTTWQEEIPNCIFQNHLFRVRVNSSKLKPYFLSKLIGSKYGKKYFLRAAKQTTGIATINTSQLRAFPVVIPPFDKQEAYENISLKLEAAKENLKTQLNASETLFQSLLQKAFNAELAP